MGAVVRERGPHFANLFLVQLLRAGKRGYRLVGDVCFEEAKTVASKITPVPGGVGPMTIAMLLKNTLNLARHSLSLNRLSLRRQVTPDGPAPTVNYGSTPTP